MYLKDKEEYVDIEMSSIMKAFVLGWLSWVFTIIIISLSLAFIISLFGLV